MPSVHFIKTITYITTSLASGYFGYEIYSTHSKLNSVLDTSVIDSLEPKPKRILEVRKNVYIQSDTQKAPSIIDRFWHSVTFSYASRLLNVAHSDDRDQRLRAIKSLSQITTLDAWHYSLIAHMCDARTAVGLARSENINLDFFLNPPNRYVHYNHDKIVSWVKHFLIALNQRSDHPCMSYFLKKAFVNVQDVGRMIEHDISSIELKQCIQSADDILPLCVQSILHHSTIKNNAKDIVDLNGLPLLMEIHKRYKDNVDITIALAKIMSNISMYPELLQEIFRSGWIGILAKFLKHDDIRINGHAAKALANLDSDDHLEGRFERKVYLLHPMHRAREQNKVDIILVHGLLGGVFFTWRQRDKVTNHGSILGRKNKYAVETCPCEVEPEVMYQSSDPYTREFMIEMEVRKRQEWRDIGKDFEVVYHDCPEDTSLPGPFTCTGEEICAIDDRGRTQCWPKDWLPRDCRNLRIIGINYDTNLSLWTPMCPLDKVKCTLNDRSEDFLEKLNAAGVGKRPIIWLCHSMGGLLAKNIIIRAAQHENPDIQNICSNTKGIVFYSTPHKGSAVASFNNTAALFLWPSVEVTELRKGSPALLKLHNEFLNLLEASKMNVLSFVETQSTIMSPLKINFHFVHKDSAELNYGEYYELPLDHLRICKPKNRCSFLYKKVVLFIQKIIAEN